MDHQSDLTSSNPDKVILEARQKRTRRVLLTVLLAAGVGCGAWYAEYLVYGRYIQDTNNAFIKADSVTISPKISGYVQAVYAGENQWVEAGAPLLKVDQREYQAQADHGRAQIAVAEASGQAIQSQIREQRSAIEKARTDEASARAEVALAQAQVRRYTPLVAGGLETAERLDQLRTQLAQAQDKLRAASITVGSATDRVSTLTAQFRQAQAQGEGARAQMRSATNDVGATTITSSIDGWVGNKAVRIGQYVQAGTRLMTIVPSALYVEANFKETQVGLVRKGQPVVVKVDSLPDVKIVGHVESISPATGAQFSVLPPQNATGNFTKVVQRIPVRVALALSPEMRARIVPGMSVEVSVDTRSARDEIRTLSTAQNRVNERAGR